MTKDEVRRIAKLARLEFEDEELKRFVPQFQQILDYFEQLGKVDAQGVEPTYHALFDQDLEDSLRSDSCSPSLSVDDSLGEAPDTGDGHFRVPKVIE